MRSGMQQIPPMNAVYFGANAAEALALEVEKRRSQRVFLLVSGTLNRETNEIKKVRELLAGRYAAEYDQIPQHMPRDAILKAAEVARSAKTDLVVTIGGGSVTDAGKRSIRSGRFAKRSAIHIWYPPRLSWIRRSRCTRPCGCGFPRACGRWITRWRRFARRREARSSTVVRCKLLDC